MKLRVPLLMIGLALAVTTPARSTTLIAMSVRQLTQASSDIVRAQAVRQASRWNQGHTQIITVTTCEVAQTLKGHVPSTIEVEQPGGRVQNVGMLVPGTAALLPESEYVLFLETPAEGSMFRLVGMAQGALRIYQDASTHEALVILPFSQRQIQEEVAGGGNPSGTVPLLGFHKYVTKIVDSGIRIPKGINFPVVITSAEAQGTGRLHLRGRTIADLFPSREVVIPAGSEVEGDADRSGGAWLVHWDEMSVRGVHAQISATSHEPEGSLQGRSVVLSLR